MSRAASLRSWWPGVLIVVLALALSWVYRDRLRRISHENAFRRQIGYICGKIHRGETSAEQLCSTPIPQIPSLRWRYERIRSQDAAWYRAHGLSWYPSVECGSGEPVFTLLERSARCHAGEVALIEEGIDVHIGDGIGDDIERGSENGPGQSPSNARGPASPPGAE